MFSWLLQCCKFPPKYHTLKWLCSSWLIIIAWTYKNFWWLLACLSNVKFKRLFKNPDFRYLKHCTWNELNWIELKSFVIVLISSAKLVYLELLLNCPCKQVSKNSGLFQIKICLSFDNKMILYSTDLMWQNSE